MRFNIIARSLFTISLALGASAAGCGNDPGEWIDAIGDGHHEPGGDPGDPGSPECPDICGAICAGLPEPETPPSCPIPSCSCEPAPECPDICGAICAGLPEPETPPSCPIPSCSCD